MGDCNGLLPGPAWRSACKAQRSGLARLAGRRPDRQCRPSTREKLRQHGRATPLLWKTVRKNTLKDHQGSYEDEVIELLHGSLPPGIQVTLIADRGFGDQKRYAHLEILGWNYVIRFRENILVEDASGCTKTAGEWVPSNGRTKRLDQARVTRDRAEVPTVVCVKKKNMKEAWCLATSLKDLDSGSVVKLYGRRFTIEETFRDQKDIHFGFGLSSTHIGDPIRRDRLLMLAAMAQALLTLLGAAGEAVGLDRMLKANTVKTRTLSLLRQGTSWYRALPNMPDERARILVEAFDKILAEHAFSRDIRLFDEIRAASQRFLAASGTLLAA